LYLCYQKQTIETRKIEMLGVFLFVISFLCGGIATNPYRLPTTVIPYVYNLTITTEFQNDFAFYGVVEIYVNISLSSIVRNDRFNISLNKGPQLFIHENETLLEVGNTRRDITPINNYYNNNTEVYTMEFDLDGLRLNATGMTNVMALLSITFESALRRDMRGYYLSSYQTTSGFVVNTAVTQFESTDARQAFPCWDEPSFKAVFQLTLIVPSALSAYSNMNEHSRTTTGGDCAYVHPTGMETRTCELVLFRPSLPMSTYLVAFTVGQFNTDTCTTSCAGVPTRVIFPVTFASDAGEFALRNSMWILSYYEKLFNLSYPLPKMDHVAVFDFSAGAMENWGLITYRTSDLLLSNPASLASEKNIVVVVAHELAHQWFGDLVTMEWWNDLWLNDGFACFVENLGVNYIQPSYEIWNDFVMSVSGALDLDVSNYTHAIEQPVSNPKEIGQLFDMITYNKGAALLRMLYEFMGEEHFMMGINEYLTKYEYSNAQSYQLWEVLSNYCTFNITAMMDTWVLNPGFPLVVVNTTGSEVILTQTRMNKDGTVSNMNNGELWQIPIVIEMSGENKDPHLMTEREYTLNLNTTAETYFLVNPDFNDYYRVWYDDVSFGMIESQFMSLSAINQFKVLSDRFALAMNNYVNTEEFLFFLKRTCDNLTHAAEESISEVSYLVWSEIIATSLAVDDFFCEYGYSNGYLSGTSNTGPNLMWSEFLALSSGTDTNTDTDTDNDPDILSGFRTFATGYLKQMYNFVGGYDSVYSSNMNISQLGPQVILALIQMGDKTAIQDGVTIYENLVVANYYSLNYMNQNLVTCVLSAALASNASYFNQITKIIYPSVDSTHQNYILSSLGALYLNSDFLDQAISFVLNETVRDNMKIRGLYSCRRCKGRFNVWTALTKNNGTAWDNLAAVFVSGFAMNDLTAVFNTFASGTMWTYVNEFYGSKGRTTSSNAKVVNQTLEGVDSRQMWLETNRDQVKNFLVAIGDYPSNGGGSSDSSGTKWYHQWWFILIIVLLSILLASGVVYLICRHRKRRAQEDYTKISEKRNPEY